MAEDITVSLIIPTWNRLEELKLLLESLASQKRQDMEVWVVDNGSVDGTVDHVRSLGGRFHVIANPVNLGPAEARNQGIVRSRGRYVWFVDSDCVFADADVVGRALDVMESNPSIGALGGEINLDRGGRPLYRVKFFRRNGETRNILYRDRDVHLMECDYLPTCNCLTRRELLLRWGGFDPEYFISAEDAELGVAIKRLGHMNVFDSRATVIHSLSDKARPVDLYIKNRNRTRFVLLNGTMTQVLCLPLFDLFSLLSPDNVGAVRRMEENPQVYKYVRGWMRRLAASRSEFKHLVVGAVGAEYLGTLVLAYLHHLIHLPATFRLRRRRPDFLARTAAKEP
jgi:GT2 family glycosyltransferase